MGFSTDTGFDAQRNGAEALWPPAFGAAIFDFDGTLAATEGLWEEGVPIALATTNDPYVLSAMAPRVDVAELFDAVVCGKEVAHATKDHPDVYLEAARRLGVDPAACLVFEDILPGVRSARGGGMMTCAVRCADPRQPREALRHEADLWLDSWTDIAL